MNQLDIVVTIAAIGMIAYAVLGGADFGGGVWDILATGPRRAEQRAAISNAIGPVWEANHVWLIFVIVTSFTCFPAAYADVCVGLYVPLSLALAGIVLRGATFVFRNYATASPALAKTLTVTFGASSLLAPFFLGDALGALAGGEYAWSSPFAIAVGIFAVAMCAQIAAVFLLSEPADGLLRADFRRRAVRATVAVWFAGALPIVVAVLGDTAELDGLEMTTALGVAAVALIAGLVVIACVAAHRDREARGAVVVEATAILCGWFGAQAPALVPARYTFMGAAAESSVLSAYLIAVACGAVFLLPALLLLFRLFKTAPAIE